MTSAAYDLMYMSNGLVILEDYLFSNDLYRPIMESPPHGEPPFPVLTPGGLLLAHQRLAAWTNFAPALTNFDNSAFNHIRLQFNEIRSHWRTAWERKVAQDLHSRLTQWRNFLEDIREKPSENADRYAYEVRLRVMIELLQGELPSVSKDIVDSIKGMDAILRSYCQTGSFVWQAEFQAGFPPENFPYLYVQVASL